MLSILLRNNFCSVTQIVSQPVYSFLCALIASFPEILGVLMLGKYGKYEYLVMDESINLTMWFSHTLLSQIWQITASKTQIRSPSDFQPWPLSHLEGIWIKLLSCSHFNEHVFILQPLVHQLQENSGEDQAHSPEMGFLTLYLVGSHLPLQKVQLSPRCTVFCNNVYNSCSMPDGLYQAHLCFLAWKCTL